VYEGPYLVTVRSEPSHQLRSQRAARASDEY
jgi:hypothetical protein